MSNNIGDYGESLILNQSVRLLSVQKNPITVEGALLILQSAVDNNACATKYNSTEYKSDDGVIKYKLRRRGKVG